ncbi:DUF3558 domain-containing protein [Nocardia sp. NPDC058633]|uniref:DUF3558 domain-containing protein n=1 Tax=Nocardia sp. NPDC058633 TaxID=3346568 RepID=UPI00365C9E6B
MGNLVSVAALTRHGERERMKRALMGVGAGAAAIAVLVGCSSAERESAEPVALFEPCTGVTADALRKAGVDPATKEAAGGGAAGWQTCEWTGETAHLRVFSTSRTLEEFESESGAAAFTDLTVAGRKGRRLAAATGPASCDVLFSADQGVIRMVVVNNATQQGADPCAILRQMGESIVPTFPE